MVCAQSDLPEGSTKPGPESDMINIYDCIVEYEFVGTSQVTYPAQWSISNVSVVVHLLKCELCTTRYVPGHWTEVNGCTL